MDRLPFQYHTKEVLEFYCPVCKSLQRSFYKPSPQARHYFSLLVLGGFLFMALNPVFGIKSLALLIPIWTVFEFSYRARSRQSIICTKCGFDPYLYKYSPAAARKKIKEHTDAKNPVKPVVEQAPPETTMDA